MLFAVDPYTCLVSGMHGLALGGPGGGAQGAQFVPHYPGMMQVIPAPAPAPAPGYASLPSMEGGAGAGQLAPSEETQPQPPQPERGQSN